MMVKRYGHHAFQGNRLILLIPDSMCWRKVGKHYCTGYHANAVAVDNDYAKGNLGFHGCTSSLIAEYYSRYERGHSDKAGDLA